MQHRAIGDRQRQDPGSSHLADLLEIDPPAARHRRTLARYLTRNGCRLPVIAIIVVAVVPHPGHGRPVSCAASAQEQASCCPNSPCRRTAAHPPHFDPDRVHRAPSASATLCWISGRMLGRGECTTMSLILARNEYPSHRPPDRNALPADLEAALGPVRRRRDRRIGDRCGHIPPAGSIQAAAASRADGQERGQILVLDLADRAGLAARNGNGSRRSPERSDGRGNRPDPWRAAARHTEGDYVDGARQIGIGRDRDHTGRRPHRGDID